MSDNWIILIPEDPQMIPAQQTHDHAVRNFRELAPNASEIKVTTSEEVRFVDCGQNFERVRCPSCRKEIEFGWWSEQMEQASEGSTFQLRSVSMPCCGAASTLHNFIYEWPQGFARFSVEGKNPNLGKLTKKQINSFEGILGCQLRVIYQRV
jgi:hypothetical protein